MTATFNLRDATLRRPGQQLLNWTTIRYPYSQRNPDGSIVLTSRRYQRYHAGKIPYANNGDTSTVQSARPAGHPLSE
ncbi:hypothetical protein KCP73_19110 [Salmonella enterica subsp. enterica]|nr:hypothetical protein KCP73_19110 [Salmonella enterica subsp. enterica]